MSDSLRERTWTFLCATFPERQIYIRSDGRVQFFVFGPLMQTIMAGITLLFLGWVAFTSVNVIFKDRIIATKDHRFQQMQSSYEARVADLQLSYDELNGALVATEDHVQSVIDDFQTKQDAIANILDRKQKLEALIGVAGANAATPSNDSAAIDAGLHAADTSDADDNDTQDAQDSGAAEAPASAADDADAKPRATNTASSVLKRMLTPSPHVLAPAKKTLGPRASLTPGRREGFLRGTVDTLSGLFGRRPVAVNLDKFPVLKRIAAQEARLPALKERQVHLLAQLDNRLENENDRFQQGLKMTGVKADVLIARAHTKYAGEGGPLIPLPPSFAQNGEGEYYSQLADTNDTLDSLSDVVKAMSAVPLIQPVNGSEFEQTSGFGVRRDPFTKSLAFHSGLDFSGPAGSLIHATAPSTVVFAGARGGYGNTVEIDHGSGIRTRYGHLRSILVSVGTKIAKGEPVGKLGSTGRSTGPHIHYEVWYEDAARDPRKFIKAGRYVLQD